MPKYFIYSLFIVVLFSCSKTEQVNVESNKAPLIFIINGGENSVDLIDVNTFNTIKKIYIKNSGAIFSHHINLSDDKKYLSVALPKFDFAGGHGNAHESNKEGGVAVIETQTGTVLSNFTTPELNHNAILVKNNSEIWTAGLSYKGLIYIFDSKTEKILSTIKIDSEPTELILFKDLVFVSCESSSFVYAVDINTKQIVKQIKVDSFPESIYLSKNEQIFVENKVKKTINIIDPKSLSVIDFLDLNFEPGAINYNIKTNELWVLAPELNKIVIFEKKQQWELKSEIKTENDPHDLKFFQNDNKAIVVNQKSNSSQIIDVTSKKVEKTFTTGLKPNGIAIWE